MSLSIPIMKAARILRQGGVITCPTEGVFGLGCLPDEEAAIIRILTIKQRAPSMGLILIAANPDQLLPWGELPRGGRKLESSAERPVTWIIPALPTAPYLVRGANSGIAVRIVQHPVAAALCEAAGSALVSTSANISGHPAARNAWVLRRQFRRRVDYIVPGRCGPAAGASEIRDLTSGSIVRAAAT